MWLEIKVRIWQQFNGEIMFQLTNSDWIGILGIIVAIVLGLMQMLKKDSKSKNKINISQKSGDSSKGDQKQSVKVNIND